MHEQKNNDDNNSGTAANMEPSISNEPARSNAIEAFEQRVDIEIISYRHRPTDADGPCAKYAIDGLVAAGILSDDSPEEVRRVTQETIVISKEESECTKIVVSEI